MARLRSRDETAAAASLRQIHPAQKRAIARVTFEVLEERVAFDRPEMDILLRVGDLSSKMHRDACVNQSIATAVSKVNQEALFAVYNAKNARPLPMIVAAEQTR